MKNNILRRLAILVAAIIMTGLIIAYLTLKSQWQSVELRTQLKTLDSESFHIADHFKDSLRQLNESLYVYGRSRTPQNAQNFTELSHKLEQWIQTQSGQLTTKPENEIMGQIGRTFQDYLHVATNLVAKLSVMGSAPVSIDEYTDLRHASQRLNDLGQSLGREHLALHNQVVANASQTIRELRILVLVSLGMLFIFALALAWAVYRDMIVPLQLKLVESESLRERQEKLASLGVLAAGVAHEIRNPLTAIKAALYIQQKKFPPDSPEAADAKIVDQEILRLERIVNDFLLFARPGDSKLSPMTADSPMRKVQALLAPQFIKDDIQLTLSDPVPLTLNADEEQIEQVLLNLVRNSADAIGQHGEIKLRARPAHRRLAGKDTAVVILEVEDNGKGIPPEVQKRLFDPFFTTKETGTGLGLSIAARIVQSHGGQLEYQTAPGHGTTFGIVLPAAVSHAEKRGD